MQRERPAPGASNDDLAQYIADVHACQERWGKNHVIALATVAVTLTLAIGGMLWAEATWHGQTAQRLDDLGQAIAAVQSGREQSRQDRDREMSALGDRIDKLQDTMNQSLREARR